MSRYMDSNDSDISKIVELLKQIQDEQFLLRKEIQRTRASIIQELIPVANKLREVGLILFATTILGVCWFSLDKSRQEFYADKVFNGISSQLLAAGGGLALAAKLYFSLKEKEEALNRIQSRKQIDDDDEDKTIIQHTININQAK